jgi:hypothetical protein
MLTKYATTDQLEQQLDYDWGTNKMYSHSPQEKQSFVFSKLQTRPEENSASYFVGTAKDFHRG